jgi:membrane protease YdiL (CAAX protease family)
VDDTPQEPSGPAPASVSSAVRATPAPTERATALLEVILCSGFPTQIVLQVTFALVGRVPLGADGRLNLWYVVALQLTDAVLLTALIAVFLRARGEDLREVCLGSRPVSREALAGVPMIFGAFAVALGVLIAVQLFAPWLHNVERNPLQDLISRPSDAAVFAVVVVVAGGLREEIQRAFLLRRFERWLGGPTVGLVVTSAVFGAGHALQGADAAIATGLLGAFWGLVYLRRRSIAAPVVSHAGFNLLQLAQLVVLGR